jgi:hypothetical protein
MPGRRTKLTFAAAALVVALLVAGCGGGTKHHTWQGEFTERLEGATAAVEEGRAESQSTSDDDELFRAGLELGRTLEFKDELIAGLSPPSGCELVQQKGKADVHGLGVLGSGLGENMTPYLESHFPAILKEGVTHLEQLEREAAECAAD